MGVHPVVERAAAGELPPWAVATEERRQHMAGVAALLAEWTRQLDLPAHEQVRWTSLGYLHDALRDADAEDLRRRVPPTLAGLPPSLLHGPAAAEHLRIDGVDDGALLRAVAYHTLGHAELGREGRALYAADFLEPGRTGLRDEWRRELRMRMPGALDEVVREILGARIQHLMDVGRPIRSETVGFWNSMASEG
jgi:HD superfamily phosphohydrolase YqeK